MGSRGNIEKLNDWIYTTSNTNGSYKAGVSSNQDHEVAYCSYIEALDQELDDMLKDSKVLTGSTVTEADVLLSFSLLSRSSLPQPQSKVCVGISQPTVGGG
jgi:glutathionyl-hydroquinone reductase